jgi:hypothetical protein
MLHFATNRYAPYDTAEMINSATYFAFKPPSVFPQTHPPIVQVTEPSHLDHCANHSGSSSINFSLCTPDSPTAIYEFDQIASRFPLPLDHSNVSPVRAERDGKVELLDVPEEIAVLNDEDELSPDADQTLLGDFRNSEAWISRDLSAWRFQCHPDANLSATSLPIPSIVTTGEPAKRSLSVISLPASLPDLSESTATSATFALSPSQDNTFTGSQQDSHLERTMFQDLSPVSPHRNAVTGGGKVGSWLDQTQGMQPIGLSMKHHVNLPPSSTGNFIPCFTLRSQIL